MMNVSWIRWVMVALVAAGCGGRTDEEGDEGPGSSDPPGSTPDEGDGEPDDKPDEPSDGGVSLPGCEKGFDASAEPDRPCNWLAKGYCYEDKLAACACVCPRDTSATSNCASGFPIEDGKVPVYCY